MPGRPSRRPKLRREIPPIAKDIVEARRSRRILNVRERIRVLEKETAALKKVLEELRHREGQLNINLEVLAKRLQECEAKNG